LGDRRTECLALRNIGNVYQTFEDYKNAFQYYAQSRSLAENLGDLSAEAEIIGNYGKLLFKENEFKRAVDSLKISIAIYSKIGETQNLIWIRSWLACAEIKTGSAQSAKLHTEMIEKALLETQKSDWCVEILWNLYQIYSSLRNDKKARESLEKAYNEVKTNADLIQELNLRKNYIEDNSMNRNIFKTWNDLSKKKTRI
jgi:tetratricopeptide (TPR) repeat protein